MRSATTMLLLLPLLVGVSACSNKKDNGRNDTATQFQQETRATIEVARKDTAASPVPFQAAPAPQPENPVPLDKWGAKILEDEWGVKIKNVTHNYHQWFILLVFTKDVEGASLASLRQAFTSNPSPIQVHFFDEDMVEIGTAGPRLTEGFLSGKKNDAVRVSVYHLAQFSHNSQPRKVEFRWRLPKAAK